jgi:hypothetical protein
MDIIVDIFGFIFEELPRRAAVAICAAIASAVALMGFAVRSHYRQTYDACHTAAGEAAQAFSNVASNHCGAANVMTKGGLVVGLAGLLLAGVMVAWFFKLLLDPVTPAKSR